jgi:hypothetical protein
MLQSSGVETDLVILPVIDTTVARLKVTCNLNLTCFILCHVTAKDNVHVRWCLMYAAFPCIFIRGCF